MLNDSCNVINESTSIMPTKHNKSKKSLNKRKTNVSKLSYLSTINFHPLDHHFIFNFIEYFYEKFDIQTAALLSCVLMRSIDNLASLSKNNASEKVRI